MIAEITGEQLRFLWQRAGGDTLKEPLQVLGPARTRGEARRRTGALAAWWQRTVDGADPGGAALYAAVRTAIRPAAWAELTAEGPGGAPVRGLLAAGPGASTLIVQDAVRESELPPWPGTPRRDPDTWSRDTGGTCRIRTGAVGPLAEALMRAVPAFAAAAGPNLHAEAGELAAPAATGAACGSHTRPATMTSADRIRRITLAPRSGEGEVVVSVPDGASGVRRCARLAWVVVAGGGYVFDGDGVRDARTGGEVRVRPAGREEVARFLRGMTAPSVQRPGR